MHFTAFISFLSLSVAVAALPADISNESNLLARVNAISDVPYDPKVANAQTVTYLATPPTLVDQNIKRIYTDGEYGGMRVWAVADTYLTGLTWHLVGKYPNGNPSESKKIISYSEGTAITTGAETSLKLSITAAFQGVGLEVGGETKTFSTIERSRVKTETIEVVLPKNSITYYYRCLYNFNTTIWFSTKEKGGKAVSGDIIQQSDDKDDIAVIKSTDILQSIFTSQVRSGDDAILPNLIPEGTTPLGEVKPYPLTADTDKSKLSPIGYGDLSHGGRVAVMAYLKRLI